VTHNTLNNVDLTADLNEAAEILHKWKSRGVPLMAVGKIFTHTAELRTQETLPPNDYKRLALLVMGKYRPFLHKLLQEVVWVQPLLDMYDVRPVKKAASRPLGGLLMECLTTLSRSKDSDSPMWAEKLGLWGLMELCGRGNYIHLLDRPPPSTPPPSLLRLPSQRRVQALLHRRPKAGTPGFHAYSLAIFFLRELFRVSRVPYRSNFIGANSPSS